MSTFCAKKNFFIILEALFSLSVDIFCMHILICSSLNKDDLRFVNEMNL